MIKLFGPQPLPKVGIVSSSVFGCDCLPTQQKLKDINNLDATSFMRPTH